MALTPRDREAARRVATEAPPLSDAQRRALRVLVGRRRASEHDTDPDHPGPDDREENTT